MKARMSMYEDFFLVDTEDFINVYVLEVHINYGPSTSKNNCASASANKKGDDYSRSNNKKSK